MPSPCQSGTTPPHIYMSNSIKPLYAALLEGAAHNLRAGKLNTAYMLAASAIDEMELKFAPHNPKLADAYRLHAGICLTQFWAAGYDPSVLAEDKRIAGLVAEAASAPRFGRHIHAARLFNSWRHSKAREIEVLALGMETQRLAQAKFDYQMLVAMTSDDSELHHHMEAIDMKARLCGIDIDQAFKALMKQSVRNFLEALTRANDSKAGRAAPASPCPLLS